MQSQQHTMRDTIAQVCELNVIINMHRIVNGNKKILVNNSITITVSQITKNNPLRPKIISLDILFSLEVCPYT